MRAVPARAGDPERPSHRDSFWGEAFAIQGSITPFVIPRVLAFGAVAALVATVVPLVRRATGVDLSFDVAPYEVAGAVLALLLVLRTNAGYERWWEARRLWGGIVNQSRNLAIDAVAYGPDDPAWRERFVRTAAAFAHVSRASLRGEPFPPEAAALVGAAAAARLAEGHMPSAVALALARMLRDAEGRMDRFAFLQADRERATLIDHVGACERILRTPLPHVYAIKVRRFLLLYLLALPFGLLHDVGKLWLVPLVTMLVAYALVSVDQIALELQNPFSTERLNHLPLDEICANIERTLLGYLRPDAGA